MLLKLGPAGSELDIIRLLGWPPRTFLVPEVTLWYFLDPVGMTNCHFWTYSGIWMSRMECGGRYDNLSGSARNQQLELDLRKV